MTETIGIVNIRIETHIALNHITKDVTVALNLAEDTAALRVAVAVSVTVEGRNLEEAIITVLVLDHVRVRGNIIVAADTKQIYNKNKCILIY